LENIKKIKLDLPKEYLDGKWNDNKLREKYLNLYNLKFQRDEIYTEEEY
jgi:hypothetical protein